LNQAFKGKHTNHFICQGVIFGINMKIIFNSREKMRLKRLLKPPEKGNEKVVGFLKRVGQWS
jgi:hypothetical protein